MNVVFQDEGGCKIGTTRAIHQSVEMPLVESDWLQGHLLSRLSRFSIITAGTPGPAQDRWYPSVFCFFVVFFLRDIYDEVRGRRKSFQEGGLGPLHCRMASRRSGLRAASRKEQLASRLQVRHRLGKTPSVEILRGEEPSGERLS